MNRIVFRSIVIWLGAALLAGCGALVPSLGPNGEPMPAIYELAAPTSVPGDLPRVPWSLTVGRPTAIGSLDNDHIAVRPTPLRIEYYADGRWTTRAPDMLHRYIIRSFQNTGLLKAVGAAAALDASYRLDTDLVHFETVYPADGDDPQVHVRIHATLLALPGGSILGARDFAATATPASPAVRDVISAFDRATAEMVQDLIRWTLITPQRTAS